MRIFDGKVYRDMTPEEIAAREQAIAQAEREHWQSISYEDAVDVEIRRRYSISQEFAILRQRDEKPDEYAEYYAYCEQCKAYVKERKGM